MYLVDTSVWIHALRPSGQTAIRSLLKPLIINGDTAITDWIVLELMTGLRTSERQESLLEWLTPITGLAFDPSWWPIAWGHAARLRQRGVTPAAADCLIATVALQHKIPLIHCDKDFEAMKPILSLQTLDWAPHLR
ncbi:MAG: PIN domain-containing protein [Nitrospirota bacterium]|nr:PIN domain-containing protein [Nitrospirota bacterium]